MDTWLPFVQRAEAAQVGMVRECKDLFRGSASELPPHNGFFSAMQENKINLAYLEGWSYLPPEYLAIYNRNAIRPELKIFKELGFEFSHELMKGQTFSSLVEHYTASLRRRNIDISRTLLPTIVVTNTRGDGGYYRAMDAYFTPKVDPAIDVGGTKDFYDVRVMPSSMLTLVSNGRYPMFASGLHDVWHLVSFLQSRDYAEKLRHGYQLVKTAGETPSKMVRLTYATEALTLADPTKLPLIRKYMTVSDPEYSSMEDFKTAVSRLSPDQLHEKIALLARDFENLVIFYGGGALDPGERDLYQKRAVARMPTLFDPHRASKIDPSFTALTMITEGAFCMSAIAKELSRESPSETVDAQSRTQLARMEYFLWKSATQISLSRWMDETVGPQFDSRSETMTFIKDVFGSDSMTYRKFLRDPS